MVRIFYLITFLIFLLIIRCSSTSEIPSCCLISSPEIQITSQKTVIERQIVGDYKELEKDAWVVSSVKTNYHKKSSARDDILFNAFKARELNREKIRVYKNEGAIGEGNDGLIKYIETPKYQKSKKMKVKLERVIAQENDARSTIFQRSLIKSGIKNPQEKQIHSLGKLFAEEQRAFARDNDWIQDNSGKWVKK